MLRKWGYFINKCMQSKFHKEKNVLSCDVEVNNYFKNMYIKIILLFDGV